MASAEFYLTDGPVYLKATATQDLENALNVSGYSKADIQFNLLVATGVSSTVDIHVETGMQIEDKEGWTTLAIVSPSTAPDSRVSTVTSGMMKYIRWNLSSLGGASEVVFDIRGMLRTK